MKLLTALLLVLLVSSAVAEDRTVLLISLQGETGLLRQDISKKLLAQFKRRYKHPLPLVVIEKATQEDLYRETRNPENRALFWISHANSFGAEAGLGADDLILDVEGTNVKDILKEVHPNLHFLAVLGCKALPILKKNSYHPNLTLVSFDRKISSQRAIEESLHAFTKAPSVPSTCSTRSVGIPVTISRQVQGHGEAVAVKVMNRGRLVGFFEKPSGPGLQTIRVYLAEASTHLDLKLVFDSGKIDAEKTYDIGDFQIHSDSSGEWTAFLDPQGQPLGVTQNVYRHRGEIPASLEAFSPFRCQ